jgi:hypothetical protein
MSKTLKLFSLLSVLIFSMVSADTDTELDKFRSSISDKYQLTITEVDPELHCFRLSNKLVCNVPKKNWETEALPEVGDKVLLTPIIRLHSRSTHTEQGELSVEIIGSDGEMPPKGKVNVWISGESEYQLYFVGSDRVCTESGWLSSTTKDVLILSDASIWSMKSGKKNDFTPGDRIIVSKCSENEYILVDLDQSFRLKGSNMQAFGMLAHEIVEPFNSSKITKE